jgi:hypothetical protein
MPYEVELSSCGRFYHFSLLVGRFGMFDCAPQSRIVSKSCTTYSERKKRNLESV